MNNEDFPNLSASAKQAIKNRIDSKSIQTLLGICTGLVADTVLSDIEIKYLRTWLTDHQSICNVWPASTVLYKLNSILADGIITEVERASLMEYLQQLTGNYFQDTGSAAVEGPTLPIDDDPSIFFKDMTYCFTGTFLYGTHPDCERAVLKLGSIAVDSINKKLNYLVIGSMVSEQWAQESYGRKIESAVKLRDEKGHDILILSERQWANALLDSMR